MPTLHCNVPFVALPKGECFLNSYNTSVRHGADVVVTLSNGHKTRIRASKASDCDMSHRAMVQDLVTDALDGHGRVRCTDDTCMFATPVFTPRSPDPVCVLFGFINENKFESASSACAFATLPSLNCASGRYRLVTTTRAPRAIHITHGNTEDTLQHGDYETLTPDALRDTYPDMVMALRLAAASVPVECVLCTHGSMRTHVVAAPVMDNNHVIGVLFLEALLPIPSPLPVDASDSAMRSFITSMVDGVQCKT